MKRFNVLLLSGILFSSVAIAGEPAFLFEDFTPATLTVKGKTVSGVSVNFDVNNQKLYYIDGEQVMEMTNCSEMDTMYVDGRRFVWHNELLCEYIPKEYGSIYVNWSLPDSGSDRNENVYFLKYDGREYEIRQLSDLYGQFPDKTSDIKHLVRDYGLTMDSVNDVVKILDFVCAGALPQFTWSDLVGYWCLEREYNDVPHRVIHFIDRKNVAVYMDTDVVNLFHGTVGLQIPGFSGLFYCPQENSVFGYTINDGKVCITNGMTFVITKKGRLKLESTSLIYRKFEQRYFAEVLPSLDARRGNPEASAWDPVPGLTVSDPNPR